MGLSESKKKSSKQRISIDFLRTESTIRGGERLSSERAYTPGTILRVVMNRVLTTWQKRFCQY